MSKTSTLTTPILSALAGLTFRPGSVDWFVCRLASHRAVPSHVWDDYLLAGQFQPAFSILTKFARLSPDNKLSARQSRLLTQLVGNKMISANPLNTGSKITPALMAMTESGKWKLCHSVLGCMDHPMLYQEAANYFRGLSKTTTLPDQAAPSIHKVAMELGQYICSEVEQFQIILSKGLGNVTTRHLSDTLDWFTWCTKTCHELVSLKEEPELSRLVENVSSSISEVQHLIKEDIDEDVQWLRAASRRSSLISISQSGQESKITSKPTPMM